MNAYEILKVTSLSTSSEIKGAWRTLMHINHPDRVDAGFPGITEAASAINSAYQYLTGKQRRFNDITVRIYRSREELDSAVAEWKAPKEEPKKTRSTRRSGNSARVLEWFLNNTYGTVYRVAYELGLTEKQVRSAIDTLKNKGHRFYVFRGRNGFVRYDGLAD